MLFNHVWHPSGVWRGKAPHIIISEFAPGQNTYAFYNIIAEFQTKNAGWAAAANRLR
jgi:hypothetical protein